MRQKRSDWLKLRRGSEMKLIASSQRNGRTGGNAARNDGTQRINHKLRSLNKTAALKDWGRTVVANGNDASFSIGWRPTRGVAQAGGERE